MAKCFVCRYEMVGMCVKLSKNKTQLILRVCAVGVSLINNDKPPRCPASVSAPGTKGTSMSLIQTQSIKER